MKPIGFMAKCQRVDIRTQYEKYGVRCFDLRIRFNKYGLGIVAHGIVEYCFTASKIYEDLAWLDAQGDCYVRVIHEVRTMKCFLIPCRTKSSPSAFVVPYTDSGWIGSSTS